MMLMTHPTGLQPTKLCVGMLQQTAADCQQCTGPTLLVCALQRYTQLSRPTASKFCALQSTRFK